MLEINQLTKSFGVGSNKLQVLKGIDMEMKTGELVALMGPSGCGKSTLLRSFNRMNDEIINCSTSGEIFWLEKNILSNDIDPVLLRRAVSMVFQKPNVFPTSIYENVAFGLRIQGIRDPEKLDRKIESSLRDAALWVEVHDRLHDDAFSLSGGQQQRLCIARALAIGPSVLLMDEPTSALDPIATAKIEQLIHELKEKVTILIVTHSMSQASRISDQTAFMYLGDLIEFGNTEMIFNSPVEELTGQYISGRFG